MNNLTTRKIVLGMLMTLVLAFSVQGIADALTLSPSTSPGDLTTLTEGATITVSGIRGSLNNSSEAESVSVRVTASTANFPDPDNSANLITSYTWTETTTTQVNDLANGNGTITIPSSVTITARMAGTLIVTVEWTPRDSSAATSKVFTFYVVPDSAIGATEPVFTAPTDGYRVGVTEVQINTLLTIAEDLPLRYTVTGGGSLQVKIDGRTRSISSSNITSSRAPVYLNMNRQTNIVSVYVEGQNPNRRSASTTIIYRYPQLNKVSGDSPKQSGAPESRLENPFTVQVLDAGGNRVPGQVVRFSTSDQSGNGTFTEHPDFPNSPDELSLITDNDQTADVTTDSQGRASVFLVLGEVTGDDPVVHTVTAQVSIGTTAAVINTRVTFEATAVPGSTASTITKAAETDGQRANAYGSLDKPLTVVVRDQGGSLKEGVEVTFNDRSGGTLRDPTEGVDPGAIDSNRTTPNDRTRKIDTDTNGEASIHYIPRDGGGVQTVSASINISGYKETLFTINGTPSGGGGGGGGGGGSDPTNTITISPSSTTGDPGETETISVTSSPTGVLVTLSSTEFANTNFSPQSGLTPFTSTLTLPSSTRSYSFFAFGSIGGATVSDSASVTVETTAPGSLTIEALGAPANGSQAVRVTVRESDGTLKSDDLSVTLTGPGISRAVETVGGTGAAAVTVPTATTSYTLTVSATGYTSGQITLSATTGQTGGSTPPPAGPVGVADSIEIDGSRQLSGTVDQAMRLRVRVLDANDNGVSDVRVTFRVLAPGRGTFAGARGNGRAVADQTDRNGYASANLTPSDDGDIIVRASAAGVSADVTFIIDVGEASADTETPTPSRDVTPSRDISPVVHVGVASRPPMLWVDGGAIYALVGASAQKFAPSVDNALNITVAGGKVYWTEKTGESAGTINSANLNGSGVTELTSILAVPMGIVVDTAGSKLYWTNSRGRIQSANLDGSRITNESQDLPSPMDIALGNGNVYWTQGNGSVRVVNLTGQKIVRDISTGSDTPGSLVIGGGKVYWTEKTGDSSGTVNSANLNGTGATQLASILAVPMGIAVDGARSKLYWSNSRGRIQSADLDGSGITNVVSGLGSPGDMVLSNSITAPAATTATSTTTASRSKYDVNGDGTVDRFDALLVVSAFGTSNNKYDVNGDGTVNVKDYDLVFDEIVDAASAPPIVGIKLSAVQIDRIQEQIDLLIATNDRSPAAMRTLIYLQQLIVTARPEKTQLLANYPNPFNPETWIPYELATDTDVRLTIYNTQGVVIRTLQLGHQSAGYYTGRDRAAYWDGRNALGEQVASGLYFYQLETDEMSLMRKMVILK